jgi:uncharacterized protein
MDKVTGFEIPVKKMDRAAKFYKSAFGWKVGKKSEDYSHVVTVEMDKNWEPREKGAINGGLSQRETHDETPMLMISVKSIEKTLDKVKKLKGRIITGRQAAGEWGWWAIIQDTEGNMFELWEDKD